MRARGPITPAQDVHGPEPLGGTYDHAEPGRGDVRGMFFYIVLFVQNVLGYSAIKAGVAFLPVTVAIAVGAGLS